MSLEHGAFLGKRDTIRAIKEGRVVFNPLIPDDVLEKIVDGQGIHLPIADEFLLYRAWKNRKGVWVDERPDYSRFFKRVKLKPTEGIRLAPGRAVHGFTYHTIGFAPNMAGEIWSRTNAARLGLITHNTAPLLQPDADPRHGGKRIVVELGNTGEMPLNIAPGAPIVQIRLVPLTGDSATIGRHGKASPFPNGFQGVEVGAWGRGIMKVTGRLRTRKENPNWPPEKAMER